MNKNELIFNNRYNKPNAAQNYRKIAFTLAEVLITLGIIGVVVAMTMPTLIQNHKKQVASTRLKKFYATINSAIKAAEVDYGDFQYWTLDNNVQDWNTQYYEKYLKNNLRVLKTKKLNDSKMLLYFPDGSATIMNLYHGSIEHFGGHFYFCPEAKNCNDVDSSLFGRKQFVFQYFPSSISAEFDTTRGKAVEPYSLYMQHNIAYVKNFCYSKNNENAKFCTFLIEMNGWKIPKDYPHRL